MGELPSATKDRTDLVFKALAASSRRRILAALAAGPGQSSCCSGEGFCGCDLATATGLGAPTISHHMRVLVDAGLVSAERQGLWVFYRLRPEAFAEAIGELHAFAVNAEGCC